MEGALFQSDEALIPAFIIEELDDGATLSSCHRFRRRCRCCLCARPATRAPLDVPFTDAVKVVSRWGSGAKDLVAAMEGGKPVERVPAH
jgi:hypothetical protein